MDPRRVEQEAAVERLLRFLGLLAASAEQPAPAGPLLRSARTARSMQKVL